MAFGAQIAVRLGALIEQAFKGRIDDGVTSHRDPLPALAQVLV